MLPWPEPLAQPGWARDVPAAVERFGPGVLLLGPVISQSLQRRTEALDGGIGVEPGVGDAATEEGSLLGLNRISHA